MVVDSISGIFFIIPIPPSIINARFFLFLHYHNNNFTYQKIKIRQHNILHNLR